MINDLKTARWLALPAALLFGACASDPGTSQPNADLDPEDRDPLVADGKAEAWDSNNNPAYVDTGFLYAVSQLPTSGAGPKPIPGSYWPVYQDNINVKWDGTMSPAEKYARAFGKDVTTIMDAVSNANGVKGHTERQTCSSASDCAGLNDESDCATSYDGSVSRCIPTWWGICHGWSPYALSEPQAKSPVTRNGVTFEPGDLEALMSLSYTNVQSKFLASRCNRMNNGSYAITYDNSGRINESECRDMNPGSFHILVTNRMGLQHQGFVIDQTTNYEVWNQPAWKFQVTNLENGALKEVTKDQAMATLGVGTSRTELFPSTGMTTGQQKSGVWTATTAGTVTFRTSGTGDADLYIKKGADATTDTSDCNSTSSTANESCAIDVQAGDQIHWMVLSYADSNSTLGVELPGTGPYVYNSSAARFFYVEMDFTFVVESAPGDVPHDANDFSKTKHYTYILEADQYGKVLGGEWSGGSKSDHPDFVWWPQGVGGGDVAGISYDDLKSLNDEAAGPQTPPADRVTLLDSVTLPYTASLRSKYARLTLPAGYQSVTVTMTGTGAAWLLVGPKGHYPIVGSSANLCEQKTAGTANQSCTFNVSPAGGVYWVRARSAAANTTVTVVADEQK
jgi:hypothetical protein